MFKFKVNFFSIIQSSSRDYGSYMIEEHKSYITNDDDKCEACRVMCLGTNVMIVGRCVMCVCVWCGMVSVGGFLFYFIYYLLYLYLFILFI
jgi:hypothetical protein